MTDDETANRIRAALDGTPERVASYVNTRAADDLRQLLAERDAAHAAYQYAHTRRLATEARLALVEREVARLRAWVGYR